MWSGDVDLVVTVVLFVCLFVCLVGLFVCSDIGSREMHSSSCSQMTSCNKSAECCVGYIVTRLPKR